MKHVTSTDNAQFKQLLKLAHSSRERRLAGQSLLDGVHLLQSYVTFAGKPQLVVISETGSGNAEISALLKGIDDVEVLLLSDALFSQLSSVATPTGVIALIRTPRLEMAPDVLETCVKIGRAHV